MVQITLTTLTITMSITTVTYECFWYACDTNEKKQKLLDYEELQKGVIHSYLPEHFSVIRVTPFGKKGKVCIIWTNGVSY